MAITLNASTSSGLVQTADTSGVIDLQSSGSTKASVSSSGLSIAQYNPGASLITSGTAVASTSGTSIDFTGIPSWVKRLTVMFDQVSASGTSNLLIQLGTSGGVQTTGYNNNWSFNGPSNTGGQSTTGFAIYNDTAINTKNGSAIFTLLNNNTWTCQGMFTQLGNPGYNLLTAGSKSLGAVLDRVRITTVNGSETFDNGSINILYE